MADKVVIEYDIQVTGADKLKSEVRQCTALTEELALESKAAFNWRQIEGATEKLEKHNNTVKKTTDAYKNVTAELKALTNQIASGKLEGKELQTAIARAAKLKDTLGDVREEITRLSSDTRKFDLIAEGASGVAGAFATAQGAMALFGDENEDLQKGILKAQAALTTLTGVQELANIATKEGGIAAKALAAAEELLAVTSEAAGVSIATATAVATGGLALVAGAIAYLVMNTDDATESTTDFTKSLQEEEQALNNVTGAMGRQTRVQNSLTANKVTQAENNLAQKRSDLADTEKTLTEIEDRARGLRTGEIEAGIDHAEELLALDKEAYALNNKVRDLRADEKVQINQLAEIKTEAAKKEIEDAEKIRIAKFEALKKEFNDKISFAESESARLTAIDTEQRKQAIAAGLQLNKDAFAKQTAEIEAAIKAVPAINIPITVNNQDPAMALQAAALEFQNFAHQVSESLNSATTSVGMLNGLVTAIFATQNAELKEQTDTRIGDLQEAYDKEIAAAGDNEKLKANIKDTYDKRRRKVERDAVIEQAKLARKQAEANKLFTIFNIIVQTASAISKAIDASPLTFGLPWSAIDAALGAAQIAVVAAQPLPPIPKFAEGVIKINGKGTETSDDIPAFLSKGESVMTARATNKYTDELKAAQEMRLEQFIMEKYLAPALRAAKIELENEAYDDTLLRHTIRKSNQENTKEIVSVLRETTTWNNYLNHRYR